MSCFFRNTVYLLFRRENEVAASEITDVLLLVARKAGVVGEYLKVVFLSDTAQRFARLIPAEIGDKAADIFDRELRAVAQSLSLQLLQKAAANSPCGRWTDCCPDRISRSQARQARLPSLSRSRRAGASLNFVNVDTFSKTRKSRCSSPRAGGGSQHCALPSAATRSRNRNSPPNRQRLTAYHALFQLAQVYVPLGGIDLMQIHVYLPQKIYWTKSNKYDSL